MLTASGQLQTSVVMLWLVRYGMGGGPDLPIGGIAAFECRRSGIGHR